MLIASPRRKASINITACDITQKSHIRYLTIFVDKHLKWYAQIQHVNSCLSTNFRILEQLHYYLLLNTLRQLYYSFIYPYISYGLMSWGTACQTCLQSVKFKMNKCVKSIFLPHIQRVSLKYYKLLEIHKLDNVFNITDSLSYLQD